MVKKKILLIVLMISILLSGCTLKNKNGEDNMKEILNKDDGLESIENNDTKTSDKLATREFLIETFGITENDIEKYEVEKVISLYSLTEEFFLEEKENLSNNSEIISVLSRLQNEMNTEKEERNEFTYLLNGKEFNGDYPDLSSIARLVVANYIADGGSSCVIDFEKSKSYYSFRTNSIWKDIRRAEKSFDLSYQEKDEIIAALKEAKVDKWKYKYVNNDEATHEVAWDFGIEFKDGTIISYKGSGAIPDSYPKLEEVLFGIR